MKRSIFILLILVILFWSSSPLAIYYFFSDWPSRGQFGDMFGSINSLFSGLALAGIIVAIVLQRKELELQRKELELTRGVLEDQKQQLKAQSETLKLQTFENTFFQLLRLHHDIVNNIDIRAQKLVTRTGRDCFKLFFENYRKLYENARKQYPDSDELTVIKKSYLRLYEKHQSDIGHYFRNLYNIIKFVKNSFIEEKVFYTDLVRAQLSSFELLLLFYNCLSRLGSNKFKPLIEEFSLLENMSIELLIDRSHQYYYKPGALDERIKS